MVEIKPKRQKVSSSSDCNQSHSNLSGSASIILKPENESGKDKVDALSSSNITEGEPRVETRAKSLLGLAYESSDNEED